AGNPGNARNYPHGTREVLMHVYNTALSMGVQPQAALGGVDQVQAMLDMGIKHFCVGNDYFMIYQWLNENAGDIRKLLAS
ncbi:MAG: hypothetical protein MK384_05265, partial [SAR202 cluster bacterium]|nr:hypothetical protein [SAR202 cluster bacterium]